MISKIHDINDIYLIFSGPESLPYVLKSPEPNKMVNPNKLSAICRFPHASQERRRKKQRRVLRARCAPRTPARRPARVGSKAPSASRSCFYSARRQRARSLGARARAVTE